MKHILKTLSGSKSSALAALILSALSSSPAAGEISFDLGPQLAATASIDISQPVRRFDDDERKALSARSLITERRIPHIGEDLRLMLVCSEMRPDGAASDVQLLLVSDAKDSLKVLQRIKLGSGAIPELFCKDGSDDVMVRMIRAGSDAECMVLSFNRKGRLAESFRISRATPDRYKLDIKGLLEFGGRISVTSKRPKIDEEIKIDLEHAMEALIEDGIYQENGRPIPALVNLKLARIGWEGEGIVWRDGGTEIEVGVSLSTLSNEPVLVGRVTFERDGKGKWQPTSFVCEPFFPYSDI